MQIKFIISLLLAVVIAIFALQNSDPVTVNFFVATTQISQALIILLSAIVGAIIALTLGIIKQHELRKSLKQKDKTIHNLESEISTAKIENENLKKDKVMSSRTKEASDYNNSSQSFVSDADSSLNENYADKKDKTPGSFK